MALLVLIASTAARAEVDPFDTPHGTNARGSKLFDEGRELLRAGNVETACTRFAESFAIEQALGTQLNLANCREQQGKLVVAWELYGDATQRATSQGDTLRAKFAQERATALAARIAVVELHLATPIANGTTVTVDGEVQPTQQRVEIRVDPREVTLAATGPTGVMSSLRLTPRAGTRTIVDVPRLHERPRKVSVGRLLLAGAFIGLGAFTAASDHEILGGLTIGTGVLIAISGPTRRGPVQFPMRVR